MLKKSNLSLMLIIASLSTDNCQSAEATMKAPLHFTAQQDSAHPSLYYNATKFPDGIFNAEDKCLIPSDRFKGSLLAWDLNGVIFQSYGNEGYAENAKKLHDENGYSWFEITKLMYRFGQLALEKKALKKKNDPRGFVWEAMFKTVADERQQKALFLATQGANKLDHDVIKLLQELEANGHNNAVLSNMGQDVVKSHIEHFTTLLELPAVTPDEKAAGQPGATASEHADYGYAIGFLSNQGNIIASETNNWLHKPDQESYLTFLAKNPPVGNKNRLTIFFDDKEENLTAAIEKGRFDLAIKCEKGPGNAKRFYTILRALSEGSEYPLIQKLFFI